jgi:putative heme iron utilization protein
MREEIWQDGELLQVIEDTRSPQKIAIEARASARASATHAIENEWPMWKQINCALGVYGSEAIEACRVFIANEISKVDTIDTLYPLEE